MWRFQHENWTMLYYHGCALRITLNNKYNIMALIVHQALRVSDLETLKSFCYSKKKWVTGLIEGDNNSKDMV